MRNTRHAASPIAFPSEGEVEALMGLCRQMADLTSSAANSVRRQVAFGNRMPLDLAESFEQLANDQLDIVALISSQHRGRRQS